MYVKPEAGHNAEVYAIPSAGIAAILILAWRGVKVADRLWFAITASPRHERVCLSLATRWRIGISGRHLGSTPSGAPQRHPPAIRSPGLPIVVSDASETTRGSKYFLVSPKPFGHAPARSQL